MLKGRSKVFAPKKVVRKPHGASAASSTRPSVERSSQTPAPSQPSQETAPATSQRVGASEHTEESFVPFTATSSQPNSNHRVEAQVVSLTSKEGDSSRPELKRKEREDESILPPAKRVPAKRVPIAFENFGAPVPRREHPLATETLVQGIESLAENPQSSTVESPIDTVPISASLPLSTIVPPGAKKGIANEGVSHLPPRHISQEPHGEGTSTTETEQTLQINSPEYSIHRNPDRSSSVTPPDTAPPAAIPSEDDQPAREISMPEVPQERFERERSGLASPGSDRSPEPPRHRYPSAQNLARLADEISDAPSNMGRAGGGSGIVSAADHVTELRPGEVNKASEIVPMGALNPDGTSGGIVDEEPASAAETGKKPKRKYTKRKKVQPQGVDDDVRTTVEMQLNRPRRVAGAKRGRKKKKDGTTKGRKQRAETPEDAENEEIDQSTLTMTDLCKDLRIGKKFSMHDEIKQRVLAKKMENIADKMRRNNPELTDLINQVASVASVASGAEPAEAGPSGTAEQVEEVETARVAGAGLGPQMRIVDGALVLDETSLQIDRQARAREEQEDMEEVVENEFTRVITSGTYMKRERAQLWDHAGTSRFYEGLAQFGTDFEMIAKLFPHRNRRQIKLKFNKEERVNPDRVTRAMVGPKKKHIDLKNFEKMADMQLEEVADIDAERNKYDEDMLEEEKKQDEAEAEITRQKKAAIQGSSAQARKLLATVSDDEDEPSTGRDSAKENRGPKVGGSASQSEGPKKRGPRKGAKKNKHSQYAGGEKVTVLGTIER